MAPHPDNPLRTVRIEARLAPDVLATLKRAAEIQGQSLSEFMVTAACEVAARRIEEAQIIRLSIADQERFAAALIDPPPLNEAMRRSMEAHRKLIQQDL